MNIFKKLLVGVAILTLLSGYFVIVSNSLFVITSQETLLVNTGIAAVLFIVFLVGFGGICGGLVHALESDRTHHLLFNGKLADTGAYGHMFIGFCGSYVALAVVMLVFGMDLSNALDAPAKISVIVQYMLYLLAIGVVGGYSGLPIISLISNAALKKVQQEVDSLKKHEEQFKEELNKQKDKVNSLNLQNMILKAESYARNEEFSKAIELLEKEYLPKDSNNAIAYHWLALCEKRRGNIEKAKEYVLRSIDITPSRLGYYNLACYLHLSGVPVQGVVEKLEKAWQYAASESDRKRFWKSLQDDPDLATLRTEDLFEEFYNKVKVQMGA